MTHEDLDPIALDALARTHQRHVMELYRIHGQRDGIDQPDITDRMPLETIRQVINTSFDQLVVVLVIILVVGLSLSGGPTP
ncbi:MAG: hypothetical protein J7605_02660 [Variovorax sp.]|nr:hypothetical protein [Variovorax sp.]